MLIDNTMDTITEAQLKIAIQDLTDELYFGDMPRRYESHLKELIHLQKELPDNFGILVRDSYLDAYITMVNYKFVITKEDFTSVDYDGVTYWYQTVPISTLPKR